MAKRIESTPKADGFRMPGEFEEQKQIWMLWPERPDNWRNGAKPAQKVFTEVAKAISQFEPVTVCVSPAQYQHARYMLPTEIRVVEMTSNDAWIRDCGPTFVVNDKGDVRAIDWEFNSWGGLLTACISRGIRTISLRRRSARSRASTPTAPPTSCSKAAPSMLTARVPCSRPRCACSPKAATPA